MNLRKTIFCYNSRNSLQGINYFYTTIKNGDDNTSSLNSSNKIISSEDTKDINNKTVNGSKNKIFYENSVNEKSKIEAKEKLNNLLKTFKDSDSSKTKFIKLAGIKKQNVDEKEVGREKKGLESNLLKTIQNVADTLGGDSKEIQHDLIESLSKFKVVLDPKKESIDLKSAHLKKLNFKYNHSSDINNFEKSKYTLMSLSRVCGFEYASGLGIFKNIKQEQNIKLKLWDVLEEENLKYLAAKLPNNYFEELIMWTNQGKLWHFPINNEQGMDEEAKVDFTEHVFLEKHLEPWCPKKGPIRHFMELVTTGLSKNPYLTVEDKKEHINWYREYFEKKKSLLIKLGTIPEIEEPVNEKKSKTN